MKALLGIVLGFVSILGCTPARTEYTNSVLRGMNPDPSAVPVGIDLFLTTSTFEYFPGCAIYHSLDLVHWKRIGYALNRPEQFAALGSQHPSLYACTLRYYEGTFYLVTTDVRGGGNFMMTAKNPAGPWSQPLPIDHGSLFFENDGKVYYTRRGPGNGQNIVQAEIDPITGKLKTPLRTISTGWPTIGAKDTQALPVQRPTLPEHLWPQEPVRDDFNDDKLGLEWNTIGPLGTKNFSLADRPGYLRLHGQHDGISFLKPTAFVGRRQTEWWTISTARMEFAPESEGERAGITVLMSPAFHYDLCETTEGGELFVELVKQVGDVYEVASRVQVPACPLLLRVKSDPFRYHFAFAAQEEFGARWGPAR